MTENDCADMTAESIAEAMTYLESMPQSRGSSMVKTKLDEAMMWLNVARPLRNEKEHLTPAQKQN